MEWSEFTQYIIDAVIGEKDARFFDGKITNYFIFKQTHEYISIRRLYHSKALIKY
jgi:hypothetical protein